MTDDQTRFGFALQPVFSKRAVGPHEERLLKGIVDRSRARQDLIEAFLDKSRYLQRVEGRALDADGDVAQPAGCRVIGEQVIGQERVEI